MGSLPSEKERKLLALRKSNTEPDFGKPPAERSVEEHITYGMLNLDKPSGPTSHEVVSWVKGILHVNKAGHGGTLDPKVTGILPVAIEESTKVIQTFLPAGKEYVCALRFHGDVSEKELNRVIGEFTGEIYQRPPLKSAVKRQMRTRTIYYLEQIEREDQYFLFKVGSEAGTYIRKLCHDMGEVAKVGAHMVELRRTKSGGFREDTLVTLHDVIDAYKFWKENDEEKYIREVITPVEDAVSFLPKVVLRDSAVDSICHGASLAVPGLSKIDVDIEKSDMVTLFTLKNELIGLGKAKMDSKQMMTENKGIAIKTDRVVMKPGTYPKMWSKDD